MDNSLTIRSAIPEDSGILYRFICELAEYEKLSQSVIATDSDIHEALFGDKPCAEALLAFWENRPVGFALYFTTFSTFVGRPGLYLEDLYVQPDYRRQGIGKELLLHLARLAYNRQCGRMEWSVLNWNEPAIQFYKKLGAKPMDEWTVYRLTRDDLERLAV